MFLGLFHYTVHHNVNFPHYFIPSLAHILQERKQMACNYIACQNKLSKHTFFLMLLAVRVRNKGLKLRSIVELCNCSGIQEDQCWWLNTGNMEATIPELLKTVPFLFNKATLLFFHFISNNNNNGKIFYKSTNLFKVLHGMEPGYLKERLSLINTLRVPITSGRKDRLRVPSARDLHLVGPKKWACSAVAPTLWNILLPSRKSG